LNHNEVWGCKEAGVFARHPCSKVTLNHNEIYDTQKAGITIFAGADGTLLGNRVHNNKLGGVYISNGSANLFDNDVFENSASGVQIKSSKATLTGNRIHHGHKNGVVVFHTGKATLEGNQIYDNGGAGVEVKTNADVHLSGNTIENCKAAAVTFASGAGGWTMNNVYAGNKDGGGVVKNTTDSPAGIVITSNDIIVPSNARQGSISARTASRHAAETKMVGCGASASAFVGAAGAGKMMLALTAQPVVPLDSDERSQINRAAGVRAGAATVQLTTQTRAFGEVQYGTAEQQRERRQSRAEAPHHSGVGPNVHSLGDVTGGNAR
jgi:parallel beta-helix repeat protein